MKKPGGFLSIIAIAMSLAWADAHAISPCWHTVVWTALPPQRQGLLNLSVAQLDWQDSQDGTAPAIAFLDGQLFQLWDNSAATLTEPHSRVALPIRWLQSPGQRPFQPERVIATAVDSLRVSLPFIYAVQDDGEVYYLAPENYESPDTATWTDPARQFSPKVTNHYRVYHLADLPRLQSEERVVTVKSLQDSAIEDDQRVIHHSFFLQTNRGGIYRYNLRWKPEAEKSEPRQWGEHWAPATSLSPGEGKGQFVPELAQKLPLFQQSLFAPISETDVVTASTDGFLSLRSEDKQDILAKLPGRPISLSAYLLPSAAVNSHSWQDRLVVWTVIEGQDDKRQVLRWTPENYELFEPLDLPADAQPMTVVASAAQVPTGEEHAFFRPIGTAGWGERVMILGMVPGLAPLTWQYEFWGVNKKGITSYQWQIPLHHRDPLVPEFRHHPDMPATPGLVVLFDKHQQLAEDLLSAHFSQETDRLFRLAAVPHFMDANRRRILLRGHFRPQFARGFQRDFYQQLQLAQISSVEAMHFANEFLLADGAIRRGILPERVDDSWLAIQLLKTPANAVLSSANDKGADVYVRDAFTQLEKRIANQYHLSQADLHSFLLAHQHSYGDLPVWEFTERILRKIDPLRVCTDRESILTQFGTVGAIP